MTLVVLLMILPPTAGASNPAVDQYVESVPTVGGNPATHDNVGGGGHSSAPRGHLSRSVRERIRSQGGSDAAQLQAVAESPELGAPSGAATGAAGSGNGKDRNGGGAPGGSSSGPGSGGGSSAGGGAEPARPSALTAATTAATGGSASSVGVLIAGLLAITLAGVATAVARRRRGGAAARPGPSN